ncbi:N-acetylmuramoyl-L-alanine amidase, partial [uncultured Campylobacter sp.]|uniref:N-acetylmuramoyl-L-alanine amidase n=1 Tax=uncultured Campylobacter sp. TaxID=218934 RepID=UPI0026016154
FDKDFIVATPNYKRSLHKELKSLYEGASQKEVRIKALKRLVYSSKNLGLDSSPYEKELARLNTKNADKTKSKSSSDESKQNSNSAEKKSSKNSKKASSVSSEDSQAPGGSKTKSAKSEKSSKAENSKNSSNLADKTPKASASENSKSSKNSSAKKTQSAKNADLSSLSKEDLEFLRSTRPSGADTAQDVDEISSDRQSSEDASAKNEEDEPSTENSELRKSSVKKEDKSAKLALNSLRCDANEIVLEFNRDLQQSDYKDFTIASNDHFRFVIDFSARQKSHNTRLQDSFVGEVRISQYNDKTVRVVLSDEKKFNASVQIDGNLMILSAVESSKSAKAARAEKNRDQKSGRKRGREQDSEPQISTIEESGGAKSTSVAAGKIYKSTKGKLIVIDPGHGGSDSGAVGNGLKEKNVVLATSKKLGALLQKRGYRVLYTRSTDVFINLRSRTIFAGKKNADMFISIHANAAPNASSASRMSGVETFFLSPARSERSKNAAALENRGDLEDMNTFSKQTFLN